MPDIIQLLISGSGFDAYTIKHQKQVAYISNNIARVMGLSDDQTYVITIGAAVHDTGKALISPKILMNPGKLSNSEYSLMKNHPYFGMKILRTIGIAPPILEIVFQHHERLDGSGYPIGLSGDQISLGARIVAVADVYSAMIEDRPYRPGMKVETVLEHLKQNAGVLYDAEVVDICARICKLRHFTINLKNNSAVTHIQSAGGAH